MRRVGSREEPTARHRDTCCDLPSCGGAEEHQPVRESGSSWTFTSPGRELEDGD